MKQYIIIFLMFSLVGGCVSENDESKRKDITKKEPEKVETIIGEIPIYELKNKTLSFLRYSRNQIFAKKGYVFKDSSLMTFFSNQDWYIKKPNQVIEVDSDEKFNVELFKYLEDKSDSIEYKQILYKFIYNDYPLFYIGWEPNYMNGRPNELLKGGFALLDTTMKWTLNCPGIPPEYIIEKSKTFIEIYDGREALRNSQIEFKNIDESCIDGEKDEIIIHLEGYSDDYNDVILGFNEKNEFSTLFDKFITIDNISKLNDSTIEINTTERCDFIGTMFCYKKYQYNTISKKITELPYDFEKVEIKTTNREKIGLYSSSKSAILSSKDSIVGYIEPETKVMITRFLDKSRCYLITSDSLIGWINDHQLQNFNVCFAD